MNADLVRLAHTGANPETIRRLVMESGWAGAIRRMRASERTSPAVKAALDVPADTRLDRLSATGVELLVEGDAAFPASLTEVPDRPLWLFCRGELGPHPGVAVVGSRRATRYGTEIARAIGARVAHAGWTVVSGLAAGIDTAAHMGAVDVRGPTTAVLGSGIDVWYPRRNRGLGEQIITDGGAVVSEFPPGTTPEPWRFPARNRIISGLAEVVIVVEAAVRSGALITARLALEHGRTVMAVPGDLSRETSAGANLLIRDGAHPVTELDSLVEELELVMGPAPVRPEHTPETEADPLLALIGPTSVAIDDLAMLADLSIGQLLARLTHLELSGEVSIEGGAVRSV